ncbi:MAG TPA: PASTA domain-containing protein, partial [Sedimentisphaerales bacterium]|nr:PASTA domain-containing protein [Sedimentisphaerales bacterium]
MLPKTTKVKTMVGLVGLCALGVLALAADAQAVELIGSWNSGLAHVKEAGSNRALLFTAHVEDSNTDMNLSSVTYGGQAMTKVIEQNFGTAYRAYVVTCILDEAGIDAATDSNFVVTWAQTPSGSAGYSSAFLANVYQNDLIGASAGNGSTSSPIQTSALATANSDMVIVAGTCTNAGEYTVENSFVEAIELSISSADGVAGYKIATGTDETPKLSHSDVNEQAIIGFVVRGGVDVPNVVDMNELDANSAITAAGLAVGTVTQQYSDTVAAGIVISQSPAAYTQVAIGSSVDLVVSLGQPVVPDVVGMTEVDANSAIIAVDNLTVDNVTQQYSDTIAAGIVISQNPAAYTQVAIGSSVDLVVSLGQPVVPDVVGMTETDANSAVIAVDNLTVGNVTQQYSDTVAAGYVISQNPAAYTQVAIGSSVDLVVSLGQPVVPDVV